jgi:glycosyltransferase involved in cell wall biosynthesis
VNELLSIVIPAHNEERELPATLEAIRGALASVGVRAEVIVVDDSSTDRTAEIAAAAGTRVVKSIARQIAATRNVGAAAALGMWLLFVDADTRVTPAALKGAVDALRSGAVGGGCDVAIEPPVPLWGRVYLWMFMLVWRRLGHAAGCFVFAVAEDFRAVGGFDEKFFASEEIWLSKALKERGRFLVLRTPVFTSGRKMRLLGGIRVLIDGTVLILRGPKAWQKREGLEMWYGDVREKGDAKEKGDASCARGDLRLRRRD